MLYAKQMTFFENDHIEVSVRLSSIHLGLDAANLHQRLPALDLRDDELAQDVGGATYGCTAVVRNDFRHFGGFQHLVEFGVHHLHNRRGGTTRSKPAVPGGDVVV